MKKFIWTLLFICALAIAAYMYWPRPAAKNCPTPMNNTQCPVTGNPIDGKSTYTHDNKQYNLCSPECQGPFSASPDKYAQPPAPQQP
jgi:YHS domain-containing protein